MELLPDIFPLIVFLTVRREFAEVVQTTEEAGGQGQKQGRHQQPVDSLLAKLTLGSFLQTKECTAFQIITLYHYKHSRRLKTAVREGIYQKLADDLS